ncbi:uncharacterized protein BO88DRAFT_83379 [Aspergillus vadensis CBS 113365]|uniref:Uncharacterized protein n=1 Tax=Aspergillus vadensis (strain CBS 113365 / IMI 142717 / IBT 24658) TaxID=1448311 RepID=A0A319B2W4_ASPVC|nr:hypothetical protein BO88DRAFT_83379 [Aspergillus vadensis CBS 113365]PYH67067.1 hypothetical protein BO88DRAFT_83379 [Aspergillus vadensis CBS 113365]
MFDRLLGDSFIILSQFSPSFDQIFTIPCLFTSSPSLVPLSRFSFVSFLFSFFFFSFVIRFICPTLGLQVNQLPHWVSHQPQSGTSKGDHHILKDAGSHPAWSIPLQRGAGSRCAQGKAGLGVQIFDGR